MTREQENTINHLALIHGRVAVRPPVDDGVVRVTVPGGRCWRVSPDGLPIQTLPDHATRWE